MECGKKMPNAACRAACSHARVMLEEHSALLADIVQYGGREPANLRLGFSRFAYLCTPLSVFDDFRVGILPPRCRSTA